MVVAGGGAGGVTRLDACGRRDRDEQLHVACPTLSGSALVRLKADSDVGSWKPPEDRSLANGMRISRPRHDQRSDDEGCVAGRRSQVGRSCAKWRNLRRWTITT